MEKEQYVIGAQFRPDGYFAVIRKESNNEKVFEQKCFDLEQALQIASREWSKLISK